MFTTYFYKEFKPHTSSGPLIMTVNWNAKLFTAFYMLLFYMIFERLKAATKRIIIFCDVIPCRVAEIYEHFEGSFCFHLLIGRRRLEVSP